MAETHSYLQATVDGGRVVYVLFPDIERAFGAAARDLLVRSPVDAAADGYMA